MRTRVVRQMRRRRSGLSSLVATLLGIVATTTGLLVADPVSAAQGDSTMQQPQHFFGRLLGTRPNWPYDMTKDEEKVMAEHFERLKRLTRQGKVLMAGPCFGKPVFGLLVLKVADEAEAKALADGDPAVKAGLMTYDLAPLTLSLMAENRAKFRYVADPSDRILHKEIVVKGSVSDVWAAWTTNAGAQTFFSPYTNIELRPGGPYEIFFSPPGTSNQRGSEDCRVLSFIPNQLLSFEWNAPPQFNELRDLRTWVTVQLAQTSADSVTIHFDQLGWGKGADWDKLYEYFDRAWSFVLENCRKRFADGPVDWTE